MPTDQDRLDKLEAASEGHTFAVGDLTTRVEKLESDEAQEIVATSKRVASKAWALIPKTQQAWNSLGLIVLLGSMLATQIQGCLSPITPPAPVPTPTPIPPAPLPPVPAKSALFIVIVHDATTDTPVLARVVNDKTMRDALVKAGHKVRIYEVHQEEYKALKFDAALAKAGVTVPAVIFQQPDGSVRAAVKMPATTSDFLAAKDAAGGS